jgi:hypothetical protein
MTIHRVLPKALSGVRPRGAPASGQPGSAHVRPLAVAKLLSCCALGVLTVTGYFAVFAGLLYFVLVSFVSR